MLLPVDATRSEAPLQPDEQVLELGWAPAGAVEQLLRASAAPLPSAAEATAARELNCGASGSRWRLRVYERHAPPGLEGPVALRCGQAVRVQMAESGALLVPGSASGLAGTPAAAQVAEEWEAAGSRSVWEVEGLDGTRGGELRWGGALRLRHTDSGAMLCADAATSALVRSPCDLRLTSLDLA